MGSGPPLFSIILPSLKILIMDGPVFGEQITDTGNEKMLKKMKRADGILYHR
jgi:hypothetical protein